jgi:heptosyltransferase-1
VSPPPGAAREYPAAPERGAPRDARLRAGIPVTRGDDAPAPAVLVVRPSSLGDVVHALALVADVRRARPALAIDWVAEEPFVALVRLDPAVRRVVPVAFRRWRRRLLSVSTWREAAAFRRELRAEHYVAVLDLQEQLKGALIAASARGARHGPDRASIREPVATLFHQFHHPIDPAQHLIDRCRQLAAAALGYAVEGPPRFGIVAPRASDAVPAQRYAVLVHATSRADKLWPESDWHALIATLTGAGYAVVLPWGNVDERQRSERLAGAAPAAIVPPRRDLPAMASLLARAELVVGVDTGLVHLAAALGVPTIAIFTTTDPALAGVERASPRARDLGGCGRVPTPDDVRAAAGELLRGAPRC